MDTPWYHRIASLACDADFILPDPVSGRYLVSGWEDITGKSKGTVHLILSVRVLYDQSREKDKLKQEIRLLWLRLGKKKAEEAEREVEHLADEGFDDAWDDIDVDEDDDAICEKPVKRKDSIENSSQKIISESEKTDESDGTITEIPTIPLPETDINEDDIETKTEEAPEHESLIWTNRTICRKKKRSNRAD